MTDPLSLPHQVSSTINHSLRMSFPVVALKSTVITHGLPQPKNLLLARDMERCRARKRRHARHHRSSGWDYPSRLTDAELERLANETNVRKISRRDFAIAILKKESGGTTVAGTMFAAHQAGIKVFATGGIGGVHEVETLDISADLQALSDTPMIVVCAGAKAILDLPATLEYLETMAVPVLGYGTDEFPAFYSRQSGLPVSARLDSPQEIVEFAKEHWKIGMKSAVLVCQPLSLKEALPREEVDGAIQQARGEAHEQGIQGQSLTPFLLARMAELTGGASLKANLALLLNNARLAAQISQEFSSSPCKKL